MKPEREPMLFGSIVWDGRTNAQARSTAGLQVVLGRLTTTLRHLLRIIAALRH